MKEVMNYTCIPGELIPYFLAGSYTYNLPTQNAMDFNLIFLSTQEQGCTSLQSPSQKREN